MKAGELFVDKETKEAALAYATEVCKYLSDFNVARDAFIAGVAWYKLTKEKEAKKS